MLRKVLTAGALYLRQPTLPRRIPSPAGTMATLPGTMATLPENPSLFQLLAGYLEQFARGGCLVCGRSSERDQFGGRVCFCDSCQSKGCAYNEQELQACGSDACGFIRLCSFCDLVPMTAWQMLPVQMDLMTYSLAMQQINLGMAPVVCSVGSPIQPTAIMTAQVQNMHAMPAMMEGLWQQHASGGQVQMQMCPEQVGMMQGKENGKGKGKGKGKRRGKGKGRGKRQR